MEQKDYLAELLDSQNEHLQKIHHIVAESIREQELITNDLYEENKASFGERLADKVAEFGGSWRFIIIFISILCGWIFLNSTQLLFRTFDPYPYILLNLILSCVAALQAPVIMMSQNRKEIKDRKRSENDYIINLKSEIEIRNLHQKIDLLIIDQMKQLFEVQKKQLELLEELKNKKT